MLCTSLHSSLPTEQNITMASFTVCFSYISKLWVNGTIEYLFAFLFNLLYVSFHLQDSSKWLYSGPLCECTNYLFIRSLMSICVAFNSWLLEARLGTSLYVSLIHSCSQFLLHLIKREISGWLSYVRLSIAFSSLAEWLFKCIPVLLGVHGGPCCFA